MVLNGVGKQCHNNEYDVSTSFLFHIGMGVTAASALAVFGKRAVVAAVAAWTDIFGQTTEAFDA